MMLAMMHVIIRDGLANDTWIAEHTTGYDELRDAVADWTPERAAAVTGVDADVIEQLAIDYATIRPAAIRTLIGAEHHENGAMFFRTLGCLPALTGAWAERGGGIAKSVGSYSDALIDVRALFRPDLERADGRVAPRELNMGRLGEILTAPHAGEPSGPGVHALIVWNCNPLATVPHAELIRAGMERDDLFTVVHEQFLTDTARYADIVLPATTQIESDDVVLPWGHLWAGLERGGHRAARRVVLEHRVLPPPRRRDGATPSRACSTTTTPCCVTRCRPSTSTSCAESDGSVSRIPTMVARSATASSTTASGRVEFASDQLERMGQPRVPTFVAPARGARRRAVRALPAAVAHPEAPHPVPQLGLLATPQARPRRGWSVRRARRRRRRRSWPRRRRTGRVWNDRASVSRPRQDHRTAAPRCRGDPVRLVEPSPSRRQGRQQPHQRHPHRVGRRRRLQRHARPGRTHSRLTYTIRGLTHRDVPRLALGQSVTCGMSGDLIYAFRVMRLPLLDAGGAHHRTDRRHRGHPRPRRRAEPAIPPRVVGFVASSQRRRIFVNANRSPSSTATAPVCAAGTSTSTRSSLAPAKC